MRCNHHHNYPLRDLSHAAGALSIFDKRPYRGVFCRSLEEGGSLDGRLPVGGAFVHWLAPAAVNLDLNGPVCLLKRSLILGHIVKHDIEAVLPLELLVGGVLLSFGWLCNMLQV